MLLYNEGRSTLTNRRKRDRQIHTHTQTHKITKIPAGKQTQSKFLEFIFISVTHTV